MFSLVLIFFFQTTVSLQKIEIPLLIEPYIHIQNSPSNPFYMKSSTIFINDSYYVEDKRNAYLHKFSSEFKLLKSLSFKGNRKGEVSYPVNVFTYKNTIVIAGLGKLAIYDSNLVHIKDISLMDEMIPGYTQDVNGELVIYHGDRTHYLYTSIDDQGRILNRIKNPKFDPLNDELVVEEIDIMSINERMFIANKGSYAITEYDKKMNAILSYKRELSRVKHDRESQTNSNDISHSIGTYLNYLFVAVTNKDKNNIYIDIIDVVKNGFDTQKIEFDLNQKKIRSIKISEAKLIIDYVDKKQGLGILIFDLFDY